MATMKFAQMATKKLQRLVSDPATSEEDKVAIQAIIDKRQAVANPEEANEAKAAELSPEEQAAIQAAEAEAANQNEADGQPGDAKPKKVKTAKPKQTMEQLEAEVAEATEKALAHRCTTILPGTAIEIGGYVKSILKEKRAMRCYLLIQSDVTEDNPTGRQFYKVYKEVTILPETVTLTKAKKKSEGRRAAVKDVEAWLEDADALVEAAGVYVGREIDLEDENKKDAKVETVIKDKRSCTVFFRIGFKDENDTHKFTHRVVQATKDETTGKYDVAEPKCLVELTDDTKAAYEEAQAKWQARAERQPRAALTPEEKVARAKDALDRAKKNLEKAQEALQNKQLEYDNAKAALDAKHDEAEAGVKADATNAEAETDLL